MTQKFYDDLAQTEASIESIIRLGHYELAQTLTNYKDKLIKQLYA